MFPLGLFSFSLRWNDGIAHTHEVIVEEQSTVHC